MASSSEFPIWRRPRHRRLPLIAIAAACPDLRSAANILSAETPRNVSIRAVEQGGYEPSTIKLVADAQVQRWAGINNDLALAWMFLRIDPRDRVSVQRAADTLHDIAPLFENRAVKEAALAWRALAAYPDEISSEDAISCAWAALASLRRQQEEDSLRMPPFDDRDPPPWVHQSRLH